MSVNVNHPNRPAVTPVPPVSLEKTGRYPYVVKATDNKSGEVRRGYYHTAAGAENAADIERNDGRRTVQYVGKRY